MSNQKLNIMKTQIEPTKSAGKEEFILLSEMVSVMKESLKKSPKVKNYEQIKRLLPQLEVALKEKGDLEIPWKKFLAIIK